MNSTEWFKPGTDKAAAMTEVEKAAARNAARPVPSMMLLDPEERKEVQGRFPKTQDDSLADDYADKRAKKSFDHVENEADWLRGLSENAHAFYQQLKLEQARIRKYEDAAGILKKQLFKLQFATTPVQAMLDAQQQRHYASDGDFYGYHPEASVARSGKNADLEADLKKTIKKIEERLEPMKVKFVDTNRRYQAMLRQEGSEEDVKKYELEN